MRCTVVLRGVTWMLCGLRSRRVARSRISSLKVAENSRLCFSLGSQRQDLLHVGQEAHVQHAVGLVEHEDLDGGQVQVALLLQVEQAAGVATRMSTPLLDAVDLRVHAHAAEDDGGGERQVLAVGADGLFHLRGEFARGREHQGGDAVLAELVGLALALGEPVQHGQRERGGLAGAGLGAGEEVHGPRGRPDGLGLDGGGGVVALLADGFQDGRSELEFFKSH
jgi:hypothetical protein